MKKYYDWKVIKKRLQETPKKNTPKKVTQKKFSQK
jgi:hypothetical protein